LRRRAEESLAEAADAGQWVIDEDMPRLVHELRVHQIELEMQNEALRESRKNAERSLAQYHELYESAPMPFLSVDRDGRVSRCNRAASAAFGQGPLTGKKLRSLFDAESSRVIESLISRAFEGSGEGRIDTPLSGADAAAPRYYLAGIRRNENADECFLALVDVTDRELSRRALDRSTQEKAMLMRELQHRVKNSLNVIYSLLGIGQNQIKDEMAIAVLEKSRARVMAMSHIYEQLYQTDSVLDVNLWCYLEHLIDPLLQTYAVDGARFKLVKEFHSIKLDARRAALAGLIFNELISNATKYAYPGNETGELRVSLLEKDGFIELCVSDDGPGLPEGFDYRNSGSMGFTILRMLSDQVGADLRVESGPRGGVSTTIRIKP
jgi:PAS domain S-box-containing protein